MGGWPLRRLLFFSGGGLRTPCHTIPLMHKAAAIPLPSPSHPRGRCGAHPTAPGGLPPQPSPPPPRRRQSSSRPAAASVLCAAASLLCAASPSRHAHEGRPITGEANAGGGAWVQRGRLRTLAPHAARHAHVGGHPHLIPIPSPRPVRCPTHRPRRPPTPALATASTQGMDPEPEPGQKPEVPSRPTRKVPQPKGQVRARKGA